MKKFLSNFAFDMRQLVGISLEYTLWAAERGLCWVDGHRWQSAFEGRVCDRCDKYERFEDVS